jgi:2-C-methyl-D-erythritol 4-phosphate cytidylyltransferase
VAERQARRHREVGVVIPAAGAGLRMGGSLPKQFLRLGRRPIIAHTLAAFDRHPEITQIVVVTAPVHLRRVVLLMMRMRLRTAWSVVAGGANRQESVWNGLHAFDAEPEVVLVHDAVRPLVGQEVISRTIRAVRRFGAAVACVRVKDTVKLEGRRGFCSRTLDRERLWAAQTPQGFSYHLMVKAHRKARKQGFVGTDEASLVERIGTRVRIVDGDYMNIKITTPADLVAARSFHKGR